MFLARVIGRVVTTRKVTGLTGVALLVIERMDGARPTGTTLVAADRAQSGEGDLVMVEDGREAALALPEPFVPVEATIVGHVEEVDMAATDAIRSGGGRA